MIDRAKSYDGLQERLQSHDNAWPELADRLRQGVVTQYALGVYTNGLRMYGRRHKAFSLAKAISLAAGQFKTYDDVVQAFGKKIPVSPEVFYDLDVELRTKYWTAAGIEDTRIVDRIGAAMAGAMAEGRTLPEFKASAYEVLRTAGYTFPEPYRLENVYRTNLAIADSAGKEDWYDQPEIREIVQGWQWVTSRSENVCEECDSLDGETWERDEPRPHEPLHPQCDCAVIAVLEDEAFDGGRSDVNWRDFRSVRDGFGRDPREMLRAML